MNGVRFERPNEKGAAPMEERPTESFRFMEDLITCWLEGAHRSEIARILDAIKAELRKRALAEGERVPSPDPRRRN